MPSGWAGKPVPPTALGDPGNPGGCDNLCSVLGPLCQCQQQGTLQLGAVSTCQTASESSRVLHIHPTARLGSPATPRRCATCARLFSSSRCEESQCSRSSSPRFPHAEQLCRELSVEQCKLLQGSAVSCHTWVMNTSFAFTPSELCGI